MRVVVIWIWDFEATNSKILLEDGCLPLQGEAALKARLWENIDNICFWHDLYKWMRDSRGRDIGCDKFVVRDK